MRSGHLEADFADGEYVFKLGWGQLVELQEKCNIGPHALLRRLEAGLWMVDDIAETIRLALIGGDPVNMQPIKAKKLVERYVKDRPLTENISLVRVILMVALFGGESVEPVDQKKKTEETSRAVADEDGKMNFQDLYGIGAVLGYTPAQVNEMSVWQLMVAYNGYAKANTHDDGSTITEEEAKDLYEFVQNIE